SSAAPIVLDEGKAASVSQTAVAIDPMGAMAQRFVRRLSPSTTRLDLVDLLAGGDGTGQRRGPAIDTLTGKFGEFSTRGNVNGDGSYHRCDLSVVDGCFIPNGRMKINSAGDEFDFGPTFSVAYDYI